MALLPCRECGREVSTEARSCPSCGAPDPTRAPRAAEAPPGGVWTTAPDSPERPVDSGGAVLGVASFFVPGLGQLIAGRVGTGVVHFIAAMFLWLLMLGWIVHLYSAYDAAR